MSRRPGLILTHRTKADGRWEPTRSPNFQRDVITAEIRLHWPDPAPKGWVVAALTEAYARALDELDARVWPTQIARPAAPEGKNS